MIYPDIDPVVWAKRYGLKLKERECIKCKHLFLSNIPVAIKGYRGFQIPLHECGPEYQRTTFVPYEQEAKAKWDELIFG